MKLKEALEKFKFLQKLNLSSKAIATTANHLARTLKGQSEVFLTPIARNVNPIETLVDWDIIFDDNLHKMNPTLLEMERANRSKFGARSIAVKWSERIAGLKLHYQSQDENHVPKFFYPKGPGVLSPISITDAVGYIKRSSSSGFPNLGKKGKHLQHLLENFAEMLDRNDPCIVYTRTTENKKTRLVWGYPFADTLFEMLFYIPLLRYQKHDYPRAALVSPDLVAERATELIIDAMATNKLLYSVDFAAFDASIKYQYIICAFDFIKSCFAPDYNSLISYVCERFYTISIVTPSGLYRGKHGVPSGSTFTNEIDSIVQLGIALTLKFISRQSCLVQGDDGVYSMLSENITEFEDAFKYAGLKLEKSKSHISNNYIMFCQLLFHIDYINDNGHIGGIYSTYRAINRILFQERFVDFANSGIKGKDYYGIRTLTILENCKNHPLHYELVKFILTKEKFSLDISDDGLLRYCKYLNKTDIDGQSLNHQYGSQVMGIRNFVSYKIAMEILADEEPSVTHDPAFNVAIMD